MRIKRAPLYLYLENFLKLNIIFKCNLFVLFILFRRLTIFTFGDQGDADDDLVYVNKSEGDLDIEVDFLIKHIHQITEEIEAEKEKLQKLEKDYEAMKGQAICLRIAKMKMMVESATKDCLKDSESKQTNNKNTLCTKIKSLLNKDSESKQTSNKDTLCTKIKSLLSKDSKSKQASNKDTLCTKIKSLFSANKS